MAIVYNPGEAIRVQCGGLFVDVPSGHSEHDEQTARHIRKKFMATHGVVIVPAAPNAPEQVPDAPTDETTPEQPATPIDGEQPAPEPPAAAEE